MHAFWMAGVILCGLGKCNKTGKGSDFRRILVLQVWKNTNVQFFEFMRRNAAWEFDTNFCFFMINCCCCFIFIIFNPSFMLTKLLEQGRNQCAIYWPTHQGTPTLFGNVVVSLERVEHIAHYTIRTFNVKHSQQQSLGSRIIIQFQVSLWR